MFLRQNQLKCKYHIWQLCIADGKTCVFLLRGSYKKRSVLWHNRETEDKQETGSVVMYVTHHTVRPLVCVLATLAEQTRVLHKHGSAAHGVNWSCGTKWICHVLLLHSAQESCFYFTSETNTMAVNFKYITHFGSVMSITEWHTSEQLKMSCFCETWKCTSVFSKQF